MLTTNCQIRDERVEREVARWLRRFERKRPEGIVEAWDRDGGLIWQRKNLFVNTGLAPLASLLAGVTSGEYALAAGFGSGNTAVALTDTDLTATPKYYNAIGANSFPSSGTVQFTLTLGTTDYGATGLTVQELGLFANTGSAGLPVAVGTANPSWAAATVETIGNLIVDSNGNIQRVTALTPSSDDKTGASAPTWATVVGNTTADNHVTWTLVALHTPPAPMLAHVVVPSFAFSIAATSNWTWAFTF